MSSFSFTPEPTLLTRRETLKLAVAAHGASACVAGSSMARDSKYAGYSIVDTNISLFQWPFQRLPLDTVAALVQKLRSLGIIQAWAGSFEGLLHRDITAVNERLASACREYEELVPIGSINPALPGWQGDLKRCFHKHQMPGVRLHPNYHGYSLSDKTFIELLQRCSDSGCFVQIAVAMEDTRTQSTLVRATDVNLSPLGDALTRVQQVQVQLLNARLRPGEVKLIRSLPNVVCDTSRVDGTDGVPQLVTSMGRNRVLFGSHAPLLIPEAALIRVHESQQLDTASLVSVYRENAHKFAGDAIAR